MKCVPVVTSTRFPPGSYTYRNIPWATACLDGSASCSQRQRSRDPAGVDDSHRVHILLVEACVEQPVDHQRHPVGDRGIEDLAEVGGQDGVLGAGGTDV